MKNDSKEIGGKLTVIDDLVEVKENKPIPLSSTTTTYRRPDENASEKEKNEWNNLLKQIFR